MKTWSECCKEAGYNSRMYMDSPRITYDYHAYKEGVCKTFDNKRDAELFSSNIEESKNLASVEAHKLFWENETIKQGNAASIWMTALREEYNFLNMMCFDYCYNQAYDLGHASGYDSIADHMDTFVKFGIEFNKLIT